MRTLIVIAGIIFGATLIYVGWATVTNTLYVPRSDTIFRQHTAILFFIGLAICYFDGMRLLIKTDKTKNIEVLKNSYVFYLGLLLVAASVIWN